MNIAKLTLIGLLPALAGCAQRSSVMTEVSEAELPDIGRLERRIPVVVDVEGRSDEPTVLLVVPLTVPELTERERAILGADEDDDIDLFEFYIPNDGRRRSVGGFNTDVLVGRDRAVRVGYAGGRRKSVSGVTQANRGVSSSGGQVVRRAGRTGARKAVTGVGGSGGVQVGYVGPKRVSAREKRRHYRP